MVFIRLFLLGLFYYLLYFSVCNVCAVSMFHVCLCFSIFYPRGEDINYFKSVGAGSTTQTLIELSAVGIKPLVTVSYTHLTLPTNREV